MTQKYQYNLDLALFNFRQAWEDDRQQALTDLLVLLTDREACLGRIALLRAAGRERPPATAAETYSDLILQPMRLFAGDLADRLTAEQIEELHRLTCDPEALWTVHCAVNAGTPLASSLSPASPTAPTDWTRLAQDPAGADRLLQAVGEFVPFWMDEYGLPRDKAEAFLAYARTRLPIAKDVRFRDCWPVWLNEFARQEGAVHQFPVESLHRRTTRLAWKQVLETFASSGALWKGKLSASLLPREDVKAQQIEELPLDAGELGTDPFTLSQALSELSWEITKQQRQAQRVHDLLAA